MGKKKTFLGENEERETRKRKRNEKKGRKLGKKKERKRVEKNSTGPPKIREKRIFPDREWKKMIKNLKANTRFLSTKA